VGIFRENGTELTGVIDRLTGLLGTRDGFNGQDKIWRTTTPDGIKRQIELGSFPNVGDEKKYQGRPHDLLIFDEAANMREAAVRFLMGWMRSTDPAQKRCRALLTFNPPTTAEGRWVIDFFAPWLDKKHPRPALPGELRYFATIDGKDVETDDKRPSCWRRRHHADLRLRPGAVRADRGDPAAVAHLHPVARLRQPLPDGNLLRVRAPRIARAAALANAQWRLQRGRRGRRDAGHPDRVGRGGPGALAPAGQAGRDGQPGRGRGARRPRQHDHRAAPRHVVRRGAHLHRGKETPDGPTVAGLTIAAKRDDAPIHIDVIGVGASPYDFLAGHRSLP
jgi:hypothetical protein